MTRANTLAYRWKEKFYKFGPDRQTGQSFNLKNKHLGDEPGGLGPML